MKSGSHPSGMGAAFVTRVAQMRLKGNAFCYLVATSRWQCASTEEDPFMGEITAQLRSLVIIVTAVVRAEFGAVEYQQPLTVATADLKAVKLGMILD